MSSYYVDVAEPVNVRKAVLQSSKQLVMSLRKYEDIKKIRAVKVDLMSQLKEISLQTVDTIDHLKQYLPELEVKLERKPASKTVSKNDLVKLEDDLKMIEEKLGLLE